MLRMSAPIMSGLAIMAHMAIADHAWSSEKPALTSFLPWPFIEKVEPIGSMSDRQCRVSLAAGTEGMGAVPEAELKETFEKIGSLASCHPCVRMRLVAETSDPSRRGVPKLR